MTTKPTPSEGLDLYAQTVVAQRRAGAFAQRAEATGWAGLATTFARFQVMHGNQSGPVADSQRRVLDELHDRYDMKHHTQAGSPQTHSLTSNFIDEYAIVDPPPHCVGRLRELATLGVERIIVVGPSAGSDRDDAQQAERMLAEEILKEFGANHSR